jgi:Lrp/AsnC family transcriptional regulator of ectoine degradation
MMTAKLDQLDKRILAALHREGRITKVRMSEVIGLSATRCCERMQDLEKTGIIRGYHADIDLRKLARLSVFQVHVRLLNRAHAEMRQFERFVAGVDEIIACQAVLGSVDYVMQVVATDVESFQLIMDELSAQENLEFEFVTFPVVKSVKGAHSVSLLSILDLAGTD